jgi:putative ABC transport system substrate-binding protein
MRRREFIALLGSGVAAWPLASRAQQAAKLPTIGFLGANNSSFERGSTDAFVQRLRELGWIDNRTVAIEYRWAEGREARFAEIAAEFVRLKVDVIFTYSTPSSIAAKKATAVIPIVFAAAGAFQTFVRVHDIIEIQSPDSCGFDNHVGFVGKRH